MKVYVIRADYGRYTDSFLKHGYVGIGWFPNGIESFDKESIIKKYKEIYPDDVKMRAAVNIGQINRFINEISNDDIVICPYNDHNLLIGKVTSKAYHNKDETSPYSIRKKVKWFKEIINRTNYSIPLQNTLRSSQTVFKVSQINEVLVSIGLKQEQSKTVDINTDFSSEPIYDAVKNHLLELDATEFELLVSYVLGTMGFSPTQETGFSGDGGIDFEGTLEVMGVAAVNLQVQVKRYNKGTIGEIDIRNFRGALKKDYQGCFITLSKFAKKAIESASDPEKITIRLVNGRQFIDILIEQYDKVMESMLSNDADELASKLKFKKMLLPE
jgi:restriction system protein